MRSGHQYSSWLFRWNWRFFKKGILIKGSNYIDILSKVKTVVFDKTGTLTTGTFEVTEIHTRNGFSKDEILKNAAVAESHSNHPVAVSIKKHGVKKPVKRM